MTRDDLHRRLDLPGPADEIKELSDTIDSMLDRLEMSFAQQERFIANASHELRTPLTTTRAALEIPLAQGRVPDHLLPAITRALEANRRSEQLIAALLRLARTAHRAEAPDHPGERTDLALVVADSRRRLGAEIEAAGLTVTTSTSAARVSGVDESLLALAVDNLVDNAIRHNDDRARMHIATGETGDRAWLEIANSGPHLTDTEAARLVEPFNRGPDTRTAPAGRSLGLGLTLVQDVTISLGGTVTLRPARDGGLIARIEFPSGE
ncbi:sensor histidine kinase [Tessaracoccus sp.]|uniref:sensor histidine kinase n=1 Tax=Tessaracoccus sp. TaxID=1971211 RepID=UPI00344FBCC7